MTENIDSKLPFSLKTCNSNTSKEKHFLLTERHLHAAWMEQKYFKNLTTTEGEVIKVISPGIWNLEAGPDFKKAHIQIGEREYYGDVEIHLTDESWYHHNHHLDSSYNQVVLHVSFWKPKVPTVIKKESGNDTFRSHLEDFLTVSGKRLTSLINLELYPYKKFIGSGRCARDLFKKISENESRIFFQKAASYRLEQKRFFLSSRIDSNSLLLTAGIAMTLGYKNNAELFLDLFLEAQNLQLETEKKFLIWLLSKTGFFQDKYAKKWESSSYYQELKSEEIVFEEILSPFLHQIRPLNHPIRRFAYLAKIHFDQNLNGLSTFFQEWAIHWRTFSKQNKWRDLLSRYLSYLPNYEDSYWNSHYLFESEKRSQFLPLIGEELKREIIINIVFPFLEKDIVQRGDPEEILAFRCFYHSLPASKTGKTKYLAHRFFGDSAKKSVLNKADIEQGAYQLHYNFCTHFEASCEGCPFVERYQNTFLSK